MIITLSGTPGAGKSTTADCLAKKLKMKRYSMGDLQRAIAKDRGITVRELGALEEKDDSIDRELDRKQQELGKKDDNFIIDGRLSAYFIPNASFRVFLDADEKTRAERIMRQGRGDEKYKSLKEAIKKMDEREECNARRYRKFYGIDQFDRNLYTHFIDTAGLTIDETADRIVKIVRGNI